MVGDEEVVPIRGQIVRVNAPQLKHAYYFDDDSYVIPCFDTVVVGELHMSLLYNNLIAYGNFHAYSYTRLHQNEPRKGRASPWDVIIGCPLAPLRRK